MIIVISYIAVMIIIITVVIFTARGEPLRRAAEGPADGSKRGGGVSEREGPERGSEGSGAHPVPPEGTEESR